jgi:tetratricopeptide (TPR) repeat protein
MAIAIGRGIPATGLLVMLLGASVTKAQIPDKFTNLQVLPKDVAKRELVASMRGIAGDLGVRCAHCHVGPDNLQGMDFASDEKRSKRAAREMLRMAIVIEQTVAKLPGHEPEPHPAITCYNCHRGMTRPPRDIRKLLEEAAAAEGMKGALATYERLRQEHYATGRYDFSERSLNSLAQRMLEQQRPEDARAALELNREYYPSSASVEATFGRLFLASGEKEKARSAFRRALELDPEQHIALWGMQQLDAPPKAP